MKLAVALFFDTEKMSAKDVEVLRDQIRDFARSAAFCRGGRLLGVVPKWPRGSLPKKADKAR